MQFLPLALALASAPASAERAAPALTLEQQTAARCAAAFALTASAQTRGEPAANALPALNMRGREYFVRVTARLMDELALDRQQVAALLQAQAGGMARTGEAVQTAKACLPFLDAAGI